MQHTTIHANEGVPCDVQFTSAATHDHFLLSPEKLTKGDVLAMDRAYIDYQKFEELLTSSLRHPKCPNGQKEALMTVGQGSASLSC